MGSPPRVRGKHLQSLQLRPVPRITPACAGKTRKPVCFRCTYEDHPRVCGENLQILTKVTILSGSPPRVRGKLLLNVRLLSSKRITPACAGKTGGANDELGKCEDHPRVCGENLIALLCHCPRQGSPPRVRGKQPTINLTQLVIRITPACAGKTLIKVMKEGAVKDHPRVCGENFLLILMTQRRLGSPPRVRGKLRS